MPLNSITVLKKLLLFTRSNETSPYTPPQQNPLNLVLLDSSPPDNSELRNANVILNITLRSVEGIPSPARRYTERITRSYKLTHNELITARKQIAE